MQRKCIANFATFRYRDRLWSSRSSDGRPGERPRLFGIVQSLDWLSCAAADRQRSNPEFSVWAIEWVQEALAPQSPRVSRGAHRTFRKSGEPKNFPSRTLGSARVLSLLYLLSQQHNLPVSPRSFRVVCAHEVNQANAAEYTMRIPEEMMVEVPPVVALWRKTFLE